MSNGIIPPDAAENFWDTAANENNKRQSLWTLALAQAYGLPCPPPGSGISRTNVTNHNYPPPAAPGTMPPSSPLTSPAAGLLSPLAKGLLLGLGGPALLGAGALLNSAGLFSGSKPSPLPVVDPIQQAVDLGTIGSDGKVIPPTGVSQ